jgi:hypothetical protein
MAGLLRNLCVTARAVRATCARAPVPASAHDICARMLARSKNLVGPYEQIEIDVRDATSNDANPPSANLLCKIADGSDDPCVADPPARLSCTPTEALCTSGQYARLFAMLWKRLTDYDRFLHVKKARPAAPTPPRPPRPPRPLHMQSAAHRSPCALTPRRP